MSKNESGGPGALLAKLAAGGAGISGTLAALAARSARATERANPPRGKFVTVQGVKLHYLERGSGSPVVLLHGNGVSALDWETSGMLDTLANTHRVIAFDRPGFGYSARPSHVEWTPARQAELFHAAAAELGIRRAVVVGHSWATLVAVAYALAYPDDVEKVVLLGGYFFAPPGTGKPVPRGPAVSLAGDILRYTVGPVIGRMFAPVFVKQLFAPAPVPERFAQFPLAMSLRPSQLRAFAYEAFTLHSAAASLASRYSDLNVPVRIIAGDGDVVVDAAAQSNRLSQLVLGRDAALVAGAGHMVHYFAPGRVISAIVGDAALNGQAQTPPSVVGKTHHSNGEARSDPEPAM